MRKKRLPPDEIIREDSGPSVTETELPEPEDRKVEVDPDDALIQEPKDHVFEHGRKGKKPWPERS
jgi:hypothetical protein